MANCTLPPSMNYYPPKSKPIDDLMMKRLKNIGDDQAAVEKESSILGFIKATCTRSTMWLSLATV